MANREAEAMNDDGVRVTRIDWPTAIPSLRVLEAIRLAVSLRIFVPVLLLMFLAAGANERLGEKSIEMRAWDSARGLRNVSDFELPDCLNMICDFLTRVATGSTPLTAAAALGFWMLLLGFCGVAAIRSAGCRFCTGSRIGLTAALQLSLHSWKAIFVSASLTWILLGLLCVAFRIGSRIGIWTHISMNAMAALLYLVGCIVLGIGWLLSLAAIAIDLCDGAEALSRGISYVLSQWLRVVLYATALCLTMMVCDLAIHRLTDQACVLATSWHGNPDPLMREEFRTAVGRTLDKFAEMICLSICLCEIAIVYVLLRNVEDGVSLREIDGGIKR